MEANKLQEAKRAVQMESSCHPGWGGRVLRYVEGAQFANTNIQQIRLASSRHYGSNFTRFILAARRSNTTDGKSAVFECSPSGSESLRVLRE